MIVIAGLAVIEPGRFGLPGAPIADRVATAGPTEEQREAHRSARRYVRALRSGDGALACATAAARLRVRPDGPCAGQSFEPLAGPTPKVADPVVTGGRATVRVRRGTAPALRLSLRREQGLWRVVAVHGR